MKNLFLKKIFVVTLALATIGLTNINNTSAQYIIKDFAGNGTASYNGDNVQATIADLNTPVGVAKDRYGNVYIADASNHIIRKVDVNGNITTIAGIPTIHDTSGDGGLATQAHLFFPTSVALDTAGNIYIADEGNARVRKITAATGIITTIAGTRLPSFNTGYNGDGYPATILKLNAPYSVAVDVHNRVYIADRNNHRIRMVSNDTLYTIAGTGVADSVGVGGPADSCHLNYPSGVTFDANGNLYIADAYNQRILMIGNNDTVQLVAGTGAIGYTGDGFPAINATLNYPYDMAIDASGNIFIADHYNNVIREVLANGNITTVAGIFIVQGIYSGDSVLATTAKMYDPNGICVDANGLVYFADYNTSRIRVLTPCGAPTISVPITGNDSICPYTTQTYSIAAVSGAMSYTWTLPNGWTGSSTTNSITTTVAANSGTIYVVANGICGNSNTDSIQIFVKPLPALPSIITGLANVNINSNQSYSISPVFGALGYTWSIPPTWTGGSSDTSINTVVGPSIGYISVNAINGCGNGPVQSLYININQTISTQSYMISTFAGNGTGGYIQDGVQANSTEVHFPSGVAKDAKGNVYIADFLNNRIRRVDTGGVIHTFAGTGTNGHTLDNGLAVNAEISNPACIAFDANGNLYFTENGYNTIRKIDTNGYITTVAGVPAGGAFAGDGGLATSARLNQPFGISIDRFGNIYFADSHNHCIRMVNTHDSIFTVAGRGTFGGFYGDGGLADTAKLQYPNGVAIDNAGNLFIADSWNNCIRKVSPSGFISTIANVDTTTGYSGDGDSAIDAELYHPYGVTVDNLGNIFIADYGNDMIREIKTDNKIYPIAGIGTQFGYNGDDVLSTTTKLNNPIDVYLDGLGNIFIGDYTNNRVRLLQPCNPPVISSSIIGNTILCPNSNQIFSILTVPSATSYTWTLPSGWGGTSTTDSITANVNGASSGYIHVTANSDCGSSNTVSLYDSITTVPAEPGIITGNVSVCLGIPQIYSVISVPNATSYTWTSPSGWSGNSSTDSLTATPNDTSGTIKVTANNACGSSIARTFNVTANMVPSEPGTITGSSSICPATSQMYSISTVPTATSYTWTLPSGWSNTSTTTSITTLAGSTSGFVSVTANNMCGAGIPQSLAVTVNTTLSQPGTISGNTTVCAGSSQTYRIAPVSCATSYIWTLPNGWSGTSTADTITLTVGNLSDSISVMASNYLGNSIPKKLGITVNTIPAQPASIIGSTTFCQNTTQIFSVTSIANATNYTWTIPSGNGWSGSSTSDSITTIAGDIIGNIMVTANNVCGNSPADTLAVNVNLLPIQPGAISGNTNVNIGSNQTYLISPINGAIGYTWTLPSYWTGTSSVDSINTVVGASIGYVSVAAINACGTGPATTLAIHINQIITTQSYIISTFAGDGTPGYLNDNVAAISSELNLPVGMCKDAIGNLYIADYANNRIRKVDTTGIITTIAGTGTPGHTGDGLPATSATIANPTGVAIDAIGNIYIADNGSHRIRKINTSGIITTIAGTSQGFSGDGGKAINAKLNSPYGVAVDKAGNVYVGDRNNHCIRKINVNDTITTIAGRGTVRGFYGDGMPGDSAMLNYPSGVAVDALGNIFIADTYNNCIRELSASGIITTIANADTITGYSGNNGLADSARLNTPYGVSVDHLGNVFIADGGNNVIREIKSDGNIYTIAGTAQYGFFGDNGLALSALMKDPLGVFIDTLGNIFIGDNSNDRIRELTPCNPPLFLDSVITGNTLICANSQQIYTINPVAGATSYTWSFPTGWSGSSTTNSITYTTINTGGQLMVTANSNCGSSAYQKTITVTINPIPSEPASIIGNTTFCEGSSQTYSVSSITRATSYTWSLPTGWSNGSTTDSITTTTNSTNGTVSVTANNVCGNSPARTLAVTGITAPTQPSSIIGITSVCASTANIYSVASVPYATFYTWTLPNGWSGNGSITDSITATSGASGGTIKVTANNSCGISPQDSVIITVSSIQQPGSISGPVSPCAGTTHTYSIAPISCATSYTWTVPPGWTFTPYGDSIVVIVGTLPGTISVVAHNNSINSTPQTLAVSAVSIPSTPASIIGPTPVCQASSQIYSVINDPNASSYTWTLPNGSWIGTSTTDSLNVVVGTGSGNITVKANNSCGTSSAQTLNVNVNLLPAQPGVISGNTLVSVGSSQSYSIDTVSGATSYTWILPQFWTGSSTDTAITATIGASIGFVTVVANNGCGSGPASTLAIAINQNITTTNYIISTVAGDSAAGYSLDSILAVSSELDSIAGVAKDAAGNIYIADYKNHRIRKVNTAGIISTIAGTGVAGFNNDGILATSAKLSFPTGVAVDAAGNIYIADNGNNRIRKVNTSGIISTIAGNNGQGYSGNGVIGTNAILHFPYGVAVDYSGNVYFSDRNNHCIRKINIHDTITTIAGRPTIAGFYGDGMPGDSAKLQYPAGVAVDALGNLFIADTYNNCIRELKTSGIISTIANTTATLGYSGDGDLAINAEFNTPYGVAVDLLGNVLIADGGNNVIREIKTNGYIYPIAGTSAAGFYGDNGLALSAELKNPIGVCVDPSGNILIGDYLNSRVRLLTPCLPPVFLDSSITGNFFVCAGSSQTYSINPAAGATSYTWTLPAGWTIVGSSTSDSVHSITNSNSGLIKVTANNICGSSTYTKIVAATINPIPSQPGPITGNSTFCQGTSQTYSISTVTGATSYSWTTPTNWSGSSNTTTLISTTNDSSGLVTVTASNVCGTSIPRTLAVNAITVPQQPGAINGLTSICANSTNTYSVTSVNSATSYSWTLPNGWNSVGSIVDSITATSGSSGGNIIVRANNSCGSSTPETLAIAVATTLQQPGIIAGNDSPCTGSYQTYSIQPVPCATSYIWSLPSGWTGSSTSNTITDTVGTLSGYITVMAHNSSGNSTPESLAVTVLTIPLTPASIVGSNSICQGSSQTYYVPNDPFATSYTWTLPNGWTGTSTTDTIHVIADTLGGSISVKANNVCGTSSAQTLAITMNLVPHQPGPITGPTNVTVGDQETYLISAVSGATSYTWVLPFSWTGSSTNTSITVTVGPSIGTITVYANNACGSSALPGTLPVTVNTNTSTTNYIISTIAGDSTAGYNGDNAGATQSELDTIAGVAKDAAGNIYIADYRNQRVRKVDIYGIITTFAGTGTAGFGPDGYPANQSKVSFPTGVAVDASGNVYIADNGNNRIRKVNASTGIITTICGAASPAFSGDGGPANLAHLHSPYGIAVDAAGNIYIGDRNNHCVRKIGTNDTIRTIAGKGTVPGFAGDNGLADSARLQYPSGVAVDALGNVFIADTWNNCIRKVNTSGIITTIANVDTIPGNLGDGDSATLAELNYPYGVCVDALGNVFIADGGNNVIREITTNGIIRPIAGTGQAGYSGDNGLATNAMLNSPIGICVDASGTVYVGDYLNSRVRKLAPCFTPALTGSVVGDTLVCPLTSQIYYIDTTGSGASYLIWNYPIGWTGITNGDSINLTSYNNSGNIVVTAHNQCGNAYAGLHVSINSVPAEPAPIIGSTTLCAGSVAAFTVPADSNATSYIWSFPNGWSGNTIGISVTPSVNDTSGIVSVKATNLCGNSVARTTAVTIKNVPPQPGNIIGPATICFGSSNIYSVAAMPNVTSYIWTFPNGWSGNSNTDSILITSNNHSGTITVAAIDSCGVGAVQSLAITVDTLPPTPGQIFGIDTACNGTSYIYSINPVPCATSYTWTIPNTWVMNIDSNNTSIQVTANTSGGYIIVTAHNFYGASQPDTLAVAINTIPAEPGPITGPTSFCASSTHLFQVSPVPNTTYYKWSFPTGNGWSGSSTLDSIEITAGTTNGNISVADSNGCGSSIARVLVDSVIAVPIQPNNITGVQALCEGTVQTYSIQSVPGATYYNWSFPSTDWSVAPSMNSIQETVGSGSGFISVVACNQCGCGPFRSLAVAVTDYPAQPGTITPSTSHICVNISNINMTINPVSGATGYIWSVSSGFSIFTNNGGTSIVVNALNTPGIDTITVYAYNACDTSIARIFIDTIFGLPQHISSLPTGPTRACKGGSATYYGVAASGATSYSWAIPNGWNGSSTADTIHVTFGGTSGWVQMTPLNQCGGTPEGGVYVTIDDTVPNRPDTIIGPLLVCQNSIHVYHTQYISTAVGYYWTLPLYGWITDSIYSDSLRVTVGDSSGYMYVESYNTCGTDSLKDSIHIVVYPSPNDTSISFLNPYLVVNNDPTLQYQWYRNDTAILNDTNYNCIVTSGGLYTVKVTNSAGCTASSTSYSILTTNGPLISQNNDFIIYPNPNAGTFTITYHLPNSQFSPAQAGLNSQFVITDLTGRMVFKDEIIGSEGTKSIDISNLDNGIYYWEVISSNGVPVKGKIAVIK